MLEWILLAVTAVSATTLVISVIYNSGVCSKVYRWTIDYVYNTVTIPTTCAKGFMNIASYISSINTRNKIIFEHPEGVFLTIPSPGNTVNFQYGRSRENAEGHTIYVEVLGEETNVTGFRVMCRDVKTRDAFIKKMLME